MRKNKKIITFAAILSILTVCLIVFVRFYHFFKAIWTTFNPFLRKKEKKETINVPSANDIDDFDSSFDPDFFENLRPEIKSNYWDATTANYIGKNVRISDLKLLEHAPIFKFSIGDTVSKINGYPCPIIFEIKDRFMVNKRYPYYKIQNIHTTIPNNYEYVPESVLKNENRAWTSSVTMHHMSNSVNVADMYPKNKELYLEPKFKVGDIVADLYLGIIVQISTDGYYVRFGSPINKVRLYGFNNKALHIPTDYEVDKWIKRAFKNEEVCQGPDAEEPIQKGFYYIHNTGTDLDGYQCRILLYDTLGRTKVKIPAFDNLELWIDNEHVIVKES